MPWLQIRFDVEPDLAELTEDLLLESGCSAVTFEDGADTPVFEPERGTTPLWQHTQVIGLYDSEMDEHTIVDQMRIGFSLNSIPTFPTFKSEILEDSEWEKAWMDHFHPLNFGNRLWVCPSWREVPDPNAVNLMLDPGLAFGTGTHPTTSLCLKWLDNEDLQDKIVVDYGCGSGILGIAGLLLGAAKMLGCDNDPQAIISTKNNAERNGVSADKYQVFMPEEFPSDLNDSNKADLVVANILAAPLISLSDRIKSCLKTGGKLGLSGLLERQIEEVKSAYEDVINFDEPTIEDGWVLLKGTKS